MIEENRSGHFAVDAYEVWPGLRAPVLDLLGQIRHEPSLERQVGYGGAKHDRPKTQ